MTLLMTIQEDDLRYTFMVISCVVDLITVEELKEKIVPYFEQLASDKFTKYFLSEIGITGAS